MTSQELPRTAGPGPTRVVIIGCGVIGKHHALVATQHADFVVTGLVDTDPAAMEQVADVVVEQGGDRPGSYGSIAEALAAGADLAAICTPSGLHIDEAEECLAAGVHVVIEKPLDVSVQRGVEFARLVETAEQRGQVVSVISQHRFDPGSQVVRTIIEEKKLGTITSAMASMAWFRSQQYYDSGDWRGTWALDGGGAVMNQGVHTVDLLRWFLGRPAEIYAHTAQLAHERIEIEDTATATIRFESGALAALHLTTAAYPGLTVRLQVHGSLGSAIIDNDELKYLHAGDGEVDANLRSAKDRANQAEQATKAGDEFSGSRNDPNAFLAGHLRQYDDIAAAIKDGSRPLVDTNEALLSLALVRAIYVSATLGQPVAFDDVLNGKYDDVEPVIKGRPAAVADA
ncbi:Gfo/Idh/MocA family protein [Microlunatus parietis]|uniref:Putative dehydrogenase n=1 Tax=Microlunatus parietis TaxID=682979 RepID=A0A7Y9I8L2_9ACTN|nr:Gfo/Idh/MocA family oxidoreductase [Microlunatus parietis]NYE72202.1 putative dehydrogenase [Microlunatus parietis]